MNPVEKPRRCGLPCPARSMAARTTDMLTAQMETQILDALRRAGITGDEATKQLAMYMNKLQYQIASGEHDGFEALLEDIYNQFNVVVDFGDIAKDRVGSSMLKIASTQKTVGGVLANLKELLGSDKAKSSELQ